MGAHGALQLASGRVERLGGGVGEVLLPQSADIGSLVEGVAGDDAFNDGAIRGQKRARNEHDAGQSYA